MKFETTTHQDLMINKWLEELKPQRTAICPPDPRFSCPDEPYTGAIGGDVTYTFTQTSLGVAVTIIDNVTKQELNVTDYDSW